MNNVSLVTTALEYYDANNESYGDIFKNVYYVKFIQSQNDMEHNEVLFYNKNKTEIFRSKYEVIGLYNSNSDTWTWAWAIPSFKKNNTNIIRKIWNYGAVLDPGERYLKTELITSRFRVADPVQLDIHVGIASYISKIPLIYKHFSYIHPKIDSDGFLQIKHENADTEHYTMYYMFLLDYKNINKINHDDTTCEDNSD